MEEENKLRKRVTNVVNNDGRKLREIVREGGGGRRGYW